jgi:hypothetical protein
MAKKVKKDEKKVVELPVREEIVPLTDAEIEYIQQQDEAEIDQYLSKFKKFNSVADSSKVEEEEDEEEETFTLDLEKGVVYEKKEEVIAGEDLFEQIKGVISESKPKLQVQFGDLITERFVSKAIASLIEKLNNAAQAAEEAAEEQMRFFGGADGIAEEASKPIYKRKEELKRSYYLGHVTYDKIPKWAESYIQDYIENAINTLLDFSERA